jgi:Transposase IS116/IS110/IS902 family
MSSETSGGLQTTKQAIRVLTNTHYMMQKLRIQTGNRICRNFAVQIGQDDGMKQDELSKEAKELLENLKSEHRLLASALANRSNTLKNRRALLEEHSGILSTPYDFSMIESYVDLERNEERLGHDLGELIMEHPLWNGFLKGVKGIGPILSAVIISELDPSAPYPSSFWKYAGLDVAEDGAGRSRRAEHLVDRTYTNKKGEQATRKSITFNMFLKTKLVGVAGPCLLRAGGDYAKIYRDYKHRLENRPDIGLAAEEAARAEKGGGKLGWHPCSPLHRHDMAVRYMIKIFLVDLHREWRAIEGLPPTLTYQEAKLGHYHYVEDIA